MESRELFYIKSWTETKVEGPVSFKEAVRLQRMYDFPVEILKVVIDSNGKEVK